MQLCQFFGSFKVWTEIWVTNRNSKIENYTYGPSTGI
jgi:hypothetical protein